MENKTQLHKPTITDIVVAIVWIVTAIIIFIKIPQAFILEALLIMFTAIYMLACMGFFADDTEQKEGKTIMKIKQNKTIKILLAVALMFTAFLMMENTVHAKTKRSTYRTINGIYNSDGTIDTADGYCWKVRKESYAYSETTVVTVKFNTHGTRNKLDDSIIKINAKNKNIQLVNDYIRHEYDLKAYRVKYISTGKLTDKMIRERAIKHTIYVEIIKSVSAGGKHGTYGKNYYIAYNKRVRKGKHVTSYCIWNPCNSYCDDVEAIADNGKIRQKEGWKNETYSTNNQGI